MKWWHWLIVAAIVFSFVGESFEAPHRTYINRYGEEVSMPVYTDEKPENATAQCNNGAYSFSKHRSGTCSREGGVAEWY